MTFLYPLGLLGLIGIPILILVYIIKNRYTEQIVSSTFLWKLSERFLKRRNPLAKLTGIISLILQLLLVATLSLIVAHPVITLPGEADEYCFVLDGSGSMNMQSDGVTRFDAAKQEILSIIDQAENGSVFSLVLVTDMTETVFELEDDRALMRERIARLECADGSADYADSIGVAQRLFNENASALTYLVTDTDYEEHVNVELINVAREEHNLSLEDVVYTDLGGGTYAVSGYVASYGGAGETDVEVCSDLSDELLGSQHVVLEADGRASFSISFESKPFYSLSVKLTASDALAADNVTMVYNIESENAYRVLLVSDTPFFLKSAIQAVSTAELEVMTVQEYKDEVARLAEQDKKMSGYGLYVYDIHTPEVLPTDGSVWFVGPIANVEGAGFSIQGTVDMEESAKLEFKKSSNSVMRKLTDGLTGDGIYVKRYIKCGLYGNFNTIFSYMGNPIVFTGTGNSGNREVVFAFSFRDSNFPVSADYLILLHNLLEYSFPAVVEKTEYHCGDMAQINVISGCNSIRVEAPSGEIVYADTASAISEFALTEVGEYQLTVDISGTERAFCIYSSLPKGERLVRPPVEDSFSIRGEPTDEGRDGVYDPMTLLFILAAVLFAAEWMVYCYDKYQFR